MLKNNQRQNSQTLYPIVERWLNKEEGSKKETCANHGIAIHVFDYWLRKYRNEKPALNDNIKGTKDNIGGFIPIEINSPSHLPAEKIEIHYPNGISVHLPPQLSMEQIHFFLTLQPTAHV